MAFTTVDNFGFGTGSGVSVGSQRWVGIDGVSNQSVRFTHEAGWPATNLTAWDVGEDALPSFEPRAQYQDGEEVLTGRSTFTRDILIDGMWSGTMDSRALTYSGFKELLKWSLHVIEAEWAATTAFKVGTYCYPATPTDGAVFLCVKGGTSGGSEPTWPALAAGTQVTDGTVVWQEIEGVVPFFGDVIPSLRSLAWWDGSVVGEGHAAIGQQTFSWEEESALLTGSGEFMIARAEIYSQQYAPADYNDPVYTPPVNYSSNIITTADITATFSGLDSSVIIGRTVRSFTLNFSRELVGNNSLGAGANTVWAATTVYSLGDIVRLQEVDNGHFYICTTAGTSGATVPTQASYTEPGITITDGTVTWTKTATVKNIHDIEFAGKQWDSAVEMVVNAGNDGKLTDKIANGGDIQMTLTVRDIGIKYGNFRLNGSPETVNAAGAFSLSGSPRFDPNTLTEAWVITGLLTTGL